MEGVWDETHCAHSVSDGEEEEEEEHMLVQIMTESDEFCSPGHGVGEQGNAQDEIYFSSDQDMMNSTTNLPSSSTLSNVPFKRPPAMEEDEPLQEDNQGKEVVEVEGKGKDVVQGTPEDAGMPSSTSRRYP